MDNKDYLKFAQSLCAEGGHTLLYLVKFGSHLYGTDSEESDTDLIGIMLPNTEGLLLNEKVNSIQHSTGDELGKNNKDDIDVVLHSLQYWLLDKLPKLEVNAMDILFSMTNKDCIIYKDPGMDILFENRGKLISVVNDPEASFAYIDYARRQVSKYGMKGTRVGVLKSLIDLYYGSKHLREKTKNPRVKLSQFAEIIVNHIGESEFLYNGTGSMKVDRKIKTNFLSVCGKQHQHTIRLSEFYERVATDYASCGDRAKKALENDGVDWKACSHAIRSLDQMEEFFRSGIINFPLQNTDLIRRVKRGKLDWVDVETILSEKFDLVKQMDKSVAENMYSRKFNFIKQFILSYYHG